MALRQLERTALPVGFSISQRRCPVEHEAYDDVPFFRADK
jgi:hypothetical protein